MGKTTKPRPEEKSFSASTLGQSVVARLVSDTGMQLFNPFLTIFAAGMRTNVVVLGWLVSVRSLMGLFSPLFGAFADRHGYRLTMRLGLFCGALGALLVGVSTNLPLVALGMIAWGIGLAAFIPSLQAYLSSQLPYEKRARGIGIVEYAWALAGIIGLFSMGWLIDIFNWRVPFFVLSAGMAGMAIVVGRFPQAASRVSKAGKTNVNPKLKRSSMEQLVEFFRLGPNAKSAYFAMLGSSCFFFAAMQLLIAHGVWLNKEYGMGPTELGTIAMLLGCADLCGSGLVSLITDRIGKRKSVLLGCGTALVGYAIMPFINTSIVLAIGGIAIARGSFEFAIVSNIALLSEQVPEMRGKVLTLGSTCNLIGMTIAGATGPWLYLNFGVWGLSIVSGGATALAIVLILGFVRERE